MPKLSREIQFTNKVFTQNDLIRLVDFFANTIINRKSSNLYWEMQRITVATTTKEGVDYSFDESELKNLSSHFQQKQINSLTASYSDNKTGNDINFRLTTSVYSTCYFQLNSKDEKWLDHKVAKANDFLNSLKEQDNFYLSNKKWLRPVGQFILALPLTYIFLMTLTLIIANFIPVSQTKPDPGQLALGTFYLYLFLIFMNVVFGEIVVARFFKYLDSLWPPIELNTGPDHLNKLRGRRKFWSLLSQTVIIPIIISLIFYVGG